MRYRISAYLDDPGAVWQLKPRQDVFTDNADTAVTTYEAVSRIERCAGAALVHEASGEILMSWGYPDPDHPLTAFYAPPGPALAHDAVPAEGGRDGREEGRVLRFAPPLAAAKGDRRLRPRSAARRVSPAQFEEAARGRVVVLSRRG